MERIIIVHWNKSTGPLPIIQYPPEREFPTKELFLKIWALHELDKESSMIEYMPEEKEDRYISILQEFEGEIYFLIINYDEDSKMEDIMIAYPDILAVVSKNLIELINTNKITRAISEAFKTIKSYAKLNKEELSLNFFVDKIKNTILQILRNGVISKQRLTNMLRQDYGFSTINIDLLLTAFLRENLLIKENVPGNKDCYFLMRDILCMRIPPKQLPKLMNKDDFGGIKEMYESELMNFYSNYDIVSEIEKRALINFLMDEKVYSLLKTLRENPISVDECLSILGNNEDLFQELLEEKIIFEAKGFVFLFSDLRFIKFTPYFIIEKLKNRYIAQDISFDEYFTHLKMLIEQLEINPLYLNYEIV